ncbi:phenylacetate--CoA ligase PaaK [Alkalihalobacillus sp. LMS39]|uniref:phenylacetate--CoA ligase PaaK n=1 Tax=Alkalihalobacillus sp. LMS39 TaxID=2924032 RepID=UPI001FB2A3C5|nr:phenylacetate--CoA ligase PaaK [Alkalihalobacillus sp. LMS39]UOE92468.1 phenylacetate--CoA ligase [Alkalihalobacillus sp. LMS39]
MNFYSELESLHQEEIQALQLKRLQRTVQHVFTNVPFYREKLTMLNVSPDDIQSLEDIRLLPCTKKQDLRDQYPFGLFAVPKEELVRIHGSSGTSGKPTIVGYTKNDIFHWSEIVARAIVTAGGQKGDIFHNAYGYGLFTGGLGLHYGAELLGCVTVPVSGGNTDRQITLIKDFQPKIIGGTPSYVLNIAERMEELGYHPHECSLQYGIFGAEPWSEELRQTIEEKLGIKAVDIYGLSEVIGPGVSIECHEAQNGLHIAEDHFFVEVINPDTLQPVPDGEDGELVFTSLTKEALPIIRYRTGDIASITREKCVCGRTTARMSRVKGRIDDMLIIRGVNIFPSEIERYLLQLEELVPHYQIHLVKKGPLDSVELHCEMTQEFYNLLPNFDLQNEQVLLLQKKIVHSMKANCLVSMDIHIQPPKTIPRSEGKAVRIIDKRSEFVSKK